MTIEVETIKRVSSVTVRMDADEAANLCNELLALITAADDYTLSQGHQALAQTRFTGQLRDRILYALTA